MTTSSLPEENCTVAIVGGGTSGLALAAELMRLQVGKVVVLEREADAGGIPRHCGHYPFGVREYGRLLKGPQYARKNKEVATRLGADIRTGTTVTALREGGELELSTGSGCSILKADRVVLCTGVRESSRAQRFISGDRPSGVLTTGALQSLVYLQGIRPFKKPIIFGSELVSFSAIQTCAHLGMKPVAMIEEEHRIRAKKLLSPYLLLNRVPLHTSVQQPRIVGGKQVEGMRFVDHKGEEKFVEADGIIISGRFRPESALLRASHIEVDPNTGGPIIDQLGRCSDQAYFATGNILRPAETSGFCWREGVETARRLADDLSGASKPADYVSVKPDDSAIDFIVPQRIDRNSPSTGLKSFYVGLSRKVNSTIQATSDGKVLWAGKVSSRPVRRVQIPMADILKSEPKNEVVITLEGHD